MKYTIKCKDRMTGKWFEMVDPRLDGSLEAANAVFDALEYSSTYVNFQIVDENGNAERDWLKEQG